MHYHIWCVLYVRSWFKFVLWALIARSTCARWQRSPSERRWFICRQVVYVGESNREGRATHKASTCVSDCVSNPLMKGSCTLLLISSQPALCARFQSRFGNVRYLKENVLNSFAWIVDIRPESFPDVYISRCCRYGEREEGQPGYVEEHRVSSTYEELWRRWRL